METGWNIDFFPFDEKGTWSFARIYSETTDKFGRTDFCMIPITVMATVRNFEVVSWKCNVVRICIIIAEIICTEVDY